MVLTKKKKEWWIGGFLPSQIDSVKMWLDNPALSGNVIESANRVSEWTGKIGGINADQPTGADQGLRTDSEIFFDGVTEFMDLSDLFAIASGDTQGELFLVAKSGADGVIGREFCCTETATDDNALQMIISGVQVAGQHRIQLVKETGGGFDFIFGNTDIGENTLAILNYSSNGTRWRLRVNNQVDETLSVAGSNTGDWIGDVVNVDSISLSALIRLSSVFGEGRFYSVVYSNLELSEVNRTLIINFLNNKPWGPIF